MSCSSDYRAIDVSLSPRCRPPFLPASHCDNVIREHVRLHITCYRPWVQQIGSDWRSFRMRRSLEADEMLSIVSWVEIRKCVVGWWRLEDQLPPTSHTVMNGFYRLPSTVSFNSISQSFKQCSRIARVPLPECSTSPRSKHVGITSWAGDDDSSGACFYYREKEFANWFLSVLSIDQLAALRRVLSSELTQPASSPWWYMDGEESAWIRGDFNDNVMTFVEHTERVRLDFSNCLILICRLALLIVSSLTSLVKLVAGFVLVF